MEDKIIEILSRLCVEKNIREQLDLELYDSGILDSMGFVEFLVELEEKLNVLISPTEIERKDLCTPRKIINFVIGKVSQ